MGEGLQSGQARGPQLVRAAQVAHEAEVRQSANGVHFATYGETGVPAPDLDRMLEAVPASIASALEGNTYFFVPLALRENNENADANSRSANEHAMVAGAYADEISDAAICHRNVELGSGNRGVFISTRLMSDRFALSFEFFINVAHAFVDRIGVPEKFAELVWQQALENVRGETSLDAWESRNVAFGRPPNADPEATVPGPRRSRTFTVSARPFSTVAAPAVTPPQIAIDEKAREMYLETAFSDAIAVYLLSLTLDFDYGELREREYPLLTPAALAARLRLAAELFPANPGYEFAVRYRRRA